MPRKKSNELTVDQLRWRLDPTTLPFQTTDELNPLKEIIGQDRGLEAFRFGMGMEKQGYNVFVTGRAGSGRMSTVRKSLEEMSKKGQVPEDLAYVNNFKNIEAPILLRFEAGRGNNFKKDIHDLIESLKKEVPRIFESQEYLNSKKETMEEYEKKGKSFFKNLDAKVKEEGFTLVDLQVGQFKRPEVMPLVDGNPMHIDQLEELVEKGRFPKEEFENLKEKEASLREEISQIFLELRDLQKEIQQKIEEMDDVLFKKIAAEAAASLYEKYPGKIIHTYLDDMIEDMAENLKIFSGKTQQAQQIMPFMPPEGDPFQPYQVNLLVDNSEQEAPPVIVESYPTYRNLFGSIERVVDRSGIWKTDFSRIKAGSFVKANGGYLVLNLLDALMEPGVWQALKRSLKTEKMEIQTYDPFYLFTTSGLKPEPIEIDTKVIVISDEYIYHMLLAFDEDVKKIFKVRADFDTSMNKNKDSIQQFADFIKMRIDADNLRPFDGTAVAALIEEAVRMTGRQEKISTSFPAVSDLIRESDYWAGHEDAPVTKEEHVEKAVKSKTYRSSRIEESLQEMIDRGTLMIDVDGEIVGQVNGLAVYDVGDYMFGKPSRITSTVSMGRAGIVNIEREADLSGKTHNKGVLILTGFLREKFSQQKPLTMSASIAFEQSYGGVDGDSASSTEIYSLLSSLSGVPIKQNIAVTGSVNQKGDVQAIGGVNQKVEGFYDCCVKLGMTGQQGVMIPDSNVKDLMLRKDVIASVKKGEFHVYAVKTIDEGIEILTGKKAGNIKADGTYPKDTINYLVSEKLSNLAEGLKKFGEKEEDNNSKAGKGGKAKKKQS
ncbi:MAG: AAA family ATPase [Desulfatiglans sp.]|jgi:ATP-dependent Lon protease|nr:AAA family ATPase [Thermodesulfobacteriota bacterium]MEE4352977.1 AAA family ATPase [Desulfatiglans sp.]